MKKVVFAMALAGSAAVAQTPVTVPDVTPAAPVMGAVAFRSVPAMAGITADTVSFVGAEFGFEGREVTGVPFSADFVTESVQTFADGNRIVRKSTMRYARDAEGRTRRESVFDPVGPFATASRGIRMIFIHDPVAGVDWTVDEQEKTARKMVLPAGASGAFTISTGVNGSADVARLNKITAERMGQTVMVRREAGSTAMPANRVTLSDKVAMEKTFSTRSEELGSKNIGGVEARGTRMVTTIAEGAIGNERAIETTSERWYSEELKTVVETSRKDPREGETTYKMTNLDRGVPARAMFEPPSDYTVTEIPVARTLRAEPAKP